MVTALSVKVVGLIPVKCIGLNVMNVILRWKTLGHVRLVGGSSNGNPFSVAFRLYRRIPFSFQFAGVSEVD
jgi:hypothetical protein